MSGREGCKETSGEIIMDSTKWKKVIDRVPHILWRGMDGCTFLGETVAVHEGWDTDNRSVYLNKHEFILLIKVLSDGDR